MFKGTFKHRQTRFLEYQVTDQSLCWGGDLRLHCSQKWWFCPDNAFTSPLIQLKNNLLFLVRSVFTEINKLITCVPAWEGWQAHVAKGEKEELDPSVAVTFQIGLNWLWYCDSDVVAAPFPDCVRFKLSFDASVSPSPESNRTSASRVCYSPS